MSIGRVDFGPAMGDASSVHVLFFQSGSVPRRLVIAFAVLAMASGGCRRDGGGSPTPDAEARLAAAFERASVLASEENYPAAAQLLRAELPNAPPEHQPAVLSRIGFLELMMGDGAGALRAAEDARRLGAATPDIEYLRGEGLRRESRLEEARDVLEPLVSARPELVDAKLSLARVRFRLEDPEEALGLFEEFLRAAPPEDMHIDEARLEYGRALRAVKRLQESADVFASLLEEEPTESEYYSELAATLYRMREREAARFLESIYRERSQRAFDEYGEEKLLREGRVGLALSQRALNREHQKRFLEAFRDHSRAVKLLPTDSRVWAFLADLLVRFHRVDEAAQVVDRAIEARAVPASGLLWTRGRIELERKRWAEARAAYEAALAALVGEESGGETRGVGAGQADRFSSLLGIVRADLEAALEARVPPPGTALEALERARAIEAKAWECGYWSGRLKMAVGDAVGAAADFERALFLAQETRRTPLPELALWFGVATGRAGDRERGRQLIERVLPTCPGRIEFYEPLIEWTEDAAAREAIERNRALAMESRKTSERLIEELTAKPFAECGREVLELAKLAAYGRDPQARDLAFLARDLARERVKRAMRGGDGANAKANASAGVKANASAGAKANANAGANGANADVNANGANADADADATVNAAREALAEAASLLLGQLRESEMAFFRLGLLREVLAVRPREAAALYEQADVYLKLHVRHEDASRAAERLHEIEKSTRSWALRIRAAEANPKEPDETKRQQKARELLEAAKAAHPQAASDFDGLARALGL